MTEFDLASSHHNAAVKRKKRLIVLMMLDSPADRYADDASNSMATLRQYVRHVGYIKYPTDDWLDTVLRAATARSTSTQRRRRIEPRGSTRRR